MTETINRCYLILQTDAFPHANNLAYSVPGSTKASAYGLVCNVHATNTGYVDLVVDVGGAGTTMRSILKNMPVPPGATLVVPTITMLAADKLRVRASANSTLEYYGSLIEVS